MFVRDRAFTEEPSDPEYAAISTDPPNHEPRSDRRECKILHRTSTRYSLSERIHVLASVGRTYLGEDFAAVSVPPERSQLECRFLIQFAYRL